MSAVHDHARMVSDYLRRQRTGPDGSLSISLGLSLSGSGAGGDGGGGGRPFSAVAGVVGGNAGDVLADRSSPASVDDYFRNSVVEPFWRVYTGTWIESDVGILCTGTLAGATPRGILICEGFGEITDGDVWGQVVSNNAGFLARWDPVAHTGYFVRMPTNATVTLLRRDSPGTGALLAGPIAYTLGDTFGVRCTGTTIDLLINGAVAASVVDATYAQGWTGLGTQADGSVVTEFHALRP